MTIDVCIHVEQKYYTLADSAATCKKEEDEYDEVQTDDFGKTHLDVTGFASLTLKYAYTNVQAITHKLLCLMTHERCTR
jgi:hypothetical protein